MILQLIKKYSISFRRKETEQEDRRAALKAVAMPEYQFYYQHRCWKCCLRYID